MAVGFNVVELETKIFTSVGGEDAHRTPWDEGPPSDDP